MRHHLAPGLFLGLLAGLAPATTLAPRTTGDLVIQAERICCAICAEVEARVDPRSGIIFTHVRLDLLEDMKGRSPAGRIELRLVGGRVGDRETVVPGMPRFRAGEESILLLGSANTLGYPVILDASLGVLPLRRNKEGERSLGARVSGLRELAGQGRVTLPEFRDSLRLHLDRARRAAEEAGK